MQNINESNIRLKDKEKVSFEQMSYGDKEFFCGGFLARTVGLIEENMKSLSVKELEFFKKIKNHLDSQSMAALTNAITSKGDLRFQEEGISYANKAIGKNISVLTDDKAQQYLTMTDCLQAKNTTEKNNSNTNDSSVIDTTGKKSKRPTKEDVVKNAYDHIIEKRWSISENVSCTKDSYRIFSPKLPRGELTVFSVNGDFLQRAVHSISNVTKKQFDIDSKIFTDGNLGMLALVNYDPNVVVSESKKTVELISPNSIKIISQERMIDLGELTKSGKVTYESFKKSVAISKLCEESIDENEEKGLPSETLRKIEEGKLWRQDLASRTRIKSLFACGEERLPKKIALDRVTNIMTLMSGNLPAGAFQDILRSHGCIRFTDPLPMKWLVRAKLVKREGERTYYIIESDTSFAFGGYS